MLLHVVPFHAGLAPFAEARPSQCMSTTPFEWRSVVGVTWHSRQSTGFDSGPPERCTWWAPTARVAVEVSPRVPVGGAALAAEPWQELQSSGRTSMFPLTCVAGFTLVAVYPRWQVPHAGLSGCGGGGGEPWHVPHAACVPSTTVQIGAAFVPPESVVPWQYVD